MPKEFGVSNRNGDSWRFQPNGKAPSFEGAFLVSGTPPSGSLGGGVLVTVGVWLAGPMAVLPMDRRVLLWQRGTQPGTLDGDFWNIRVRR